MNFEGAPMMDGSWYNPATKDSFTVRDSYFEDNEMYVLTMDGRRLNYNIVQNYIKCSPKDIESMKKIDIPKPLGNINTQPVIDELLTDDEIVVQSKEGTPLQSKGGPVKPKSKNHDVIDKALAKVTKPSIELNIKWDDFPKRELELLFDIMDVSVEEVVDYLLDYYYNNTNITLVLGDEIKKYLDKFRSVYHVDEFIDK